MPQFKMDFDGLPVLVRYVGVEVSQQSMNHPEEGGAEDVTAYLMHPTDPKKNIDLTPYLSQELQQLIAEEAQEHFITYWESEIANMADMEYDRIREREFEAA